MSPLANQVALPTEVLPTEVPLTPSSLPGLRVVSYLQILSLVGMLLFSTGLGSVAVMGTAILKPVKLYGEYFGAALGYPGLFMDVAPLDYENDAHYPARSLGPETRTPAEFERQGALVISSAMLLDEHPETFDEIVRSIHQHIHVVILVRNGLDVAKATHRLWKSGVTTEKIHFVETQHDSMWVRDYGPTLVVRKDESRVALDAHYLAKGRLGDDKVPKALGYSLKLASIPVPLHLPGGNLQTNGQGLFISTKDLWQKQFFAGTQDQRYVEALLQRFFGMQQMIWLEPIEGESTGHVDMFAVFLSADTVIVGQIDPSFDSTNAAILDRNAEKLQNVTTANGPMRVIRVPMGHEASAEHPWRSYTNVAFANGVLLVPTYSTADPQESEHVLSVYQQVLPDWTIMGVEVEKLALEGGAIHCITRGLADGIQLPGFYTPCVDTVVQFWSGVSMMVMLGLTIFNFRNFQHRTAGRRRIASRVSRL